MVGDLCDLRVALDAEQYVDLYIVSILKILAQFGYPFLRVLSQRRRYFDVLPSDDNPAILGHIRDTPLIDGVIAERHIDFLTNHTSLWKAGTPLEPTSIQRTSTDQGQKAPPPN